MFGIPLHVVGFGVLVFAVVFSYGVAQCAAHGTLRIR